MVDTTLDKLLLQAVQESTEIIAETEDNPALLLKDIPIFFIGDKRMETEAERIVLARTENNPGEDGFDYIERKVQYGFHLQIKETRDYVAAMDRLNAFEQALVHTLMKSTLLDNYRNIMVIEDIKYYYTEDSILQTEEVYVSFNLDEDYSTTDPEIKEIDMRGELID